jgi:hypothetical protein
VINLLEAVLQVVVGGRSMRWSLVVGSWTGRGLNLRVGAGGSGRSNDWVE